VRGGPPVLHYNSGEKSNDEFDIIIFIQPLS
jgi:hypothetical protein